MKHLSTCQVMWTNKIIATGHLKIHKSSISVLCTVKDWLSSVGSHLFEFLALTSLKTTKVQLLLWHLSAIWQCYATSVNQSCVVEGSISHQYGFNKMEQQPTEQGHQWVLCGKCFHSTSFPVAAMFHGRHVRLISPPVITFYGGTSKAESHQLRFILILFKQALFNGSAILIFLYWWWPAHICVFSIVLVGFADECWPGVGKMQLKISALLNQHRSSPAVNLWCSITELPKASARMLTFAEIALTYVYHHFQH